MTRYTNAGPLLAAVLACVSVILIVGGAVAVLLGGEWGVICAGVAAGTLSVKVDS